MFPIISVIISTYNRASLLKEAILSLLNQDYPKELYEIIVVDNNCTDMTSDTVKRINESYKCRIVYLKEHRQGLSFARNTGARHAQGDVLAFIDDDAEADTSWISSIMEIYKYYTDSACVGGKTMPVYEGRKPEWPESGYWEGFYGKVDFGEQVKQLCYPDCILGMNFSVKKQVFFEMGGFNTNLGRNNKTLISHEEIYFCNKIYRKGGKIIYTPNALVYHKISKDRINFSFLYKRFYWQGISEVISEQCMDKISRKQVFRKLILHSKTLLNFIFNTAKSRIIYNRKITMRNKYYILNYLGKARQDIFSLISFKR